MDIDIRERSRSFFTRELDINIPEAMVNQRVDQEIEDVGRVYSRRGFRTGNVPHNIIRQHLGSAIRTFMIDNLVEAAVAKATHGLCLTAEPDIEVTSISGDVELSLSLRIRPELPCPCGIRGLRYTASLPAYYSALEPVNTAAVANFCEQTIKELDQYYAQRRAVA